MEAFSYMCINASVLYAFSLPGIVLVDMDVAVLVWDC